MFALFFDCAVLSTSFYSPPTKKNYSSISMCSFFESEISLNNSYIFSFSDSTPPFLGQT
jgi:hypothetical protein